MEDEAGGGGAGIGGGGRLTAVGCNSLRIISFVVLCQVVSLFATPHLSAAFKRVAVGEKPPPFELNSLDGKPVSSGDIFGKDVTVVVFWATWSPRSSEILADLERLRQDLGETPFRVLAINAERERLLTADQKAISGLVKDLGLTSTILVDDGLVTYNAYGVMALQSLLPAAD